MLVPVVVRQAGDAFELVAGFHRIAAARSLGLAEVPVVVREVDTEDADRAVENITSCRRRHDVIYADRVVMPTSESKCPTVRCDQLARGRHKNPDGSRQSGGASWVCLDRCCGDVSRRRSRVCCVDEFRGDVTADGTAGNHRHGASRGDLGAVTARRAVLSYGEWVFPGQSTG